MRVLIACCALLVACQEDREPLGSPCPTDLSWLVGYRGLSVDDRAQVTAWFEPRDPPVVALPALPVAFYTTPAGTEVLSVEPGRPGFFRIHPPAVLGAGRLALGMGVCRVELQAVWRPNLEQDPVLGRAELLRKEKRWAEAEALWASAESDPALLVWARAWRATTAYQAGDRARALELQRDGARRIGALGHYTEAAALLRAAAFRLLEVHRYADARAHLSEAEALLVGRHDPEGRARVNYYLGRLEAGVYRAREAEVAFRRAIAEAEAIGDSALVRVYRMTLAMHLSDRGQHQAALAVFPSAEDATWHERQNLSWIELEAMRTCQVAPALDRVQAALTAIGRDAPPTASPADVANVWSNAGYAAWLAGNPAAARGALASARAADPRGGLYPLFVRRLEANLLWTQGDMVGAEQAFRHLLTEARALHGEPINDDAWRAHEGLARVFAARGESEAARAAWSEAARLLNEVSSRLSLQVGRAAFHADRRALLDAFLGALLAAGRVGEALQALEAFRAPVLRTLGREAALQQMSGEALERWSRLIEGVEESRLNLAETLKKCREVPRDQVGACELEARQRSDEAAKKLDEVHGTAAQVTPARAFSPAALASDEALLVWLPIRPPGTCDTRWHRVLVHGGRAEVITQPIDFIRSFSGHVYVLAHGSKEAMDLPFALLDGQPVAAQRGLTFIPHLSWLQAPASPPGTGGLIVADPERNLLASARTGRALAQRSPDARLLLDDQATRAAVRRQLEGGLRWFHFDGHGVLNPEDPWNAHLRLAEGGALTTADLLVHRPRIGTVVLSACQSGEAAPLSDAESLSLAEAFLLAGADQVLAVEGEVTDAEAAWVTGLFYQHGGPDDAVRAWQATARELHQRDPGPGWHRWRLFGRRTVGGRAPAP